MTVIVNVELVWLFWSLWL